MKLSKQVLLELRKIINGDDVYNNYFKECSTIYRSGPKLIDFFNQFPGITQPYKYGDRIKPFPSRYHYTDEMLE